LPGLLFAQSAMGYAQATVSLPLELGFSTAERDFYKSSLG